MAAEECPRLVTAADLPWEVWHTVFGFLSESDIKCCRLVCRDWMELSMERGLLALISKRQGVVRFSGHWFGAGESTGCTFLLKAYLTVDKTPAKSDTSDVLPISGQLRWKAEEVKSDQLNWFRPYLGKIEVEYVAGELNVKTNKVTLRGYRRSGILKSCELPNPPIRPCALCECQYFDTFLYAEEHYDACEVCHHPRLLHNVTSSLSHAIACNIYDIDLPESAALEIFHGKSFDLDNELTGSIECRRNTILEKTPSAWKW